MHSFTREDPTQAPRVDPSVAAEILERCYGLVKGKSGHLLSLTGYEDVNFKVVDHESNGTNEHLGNVEQHYVLKISNPVENRTFGLVEAQDLLAADVRAKGIPCAESIVRCDGKIWAHEQVTWIDPPDILPVRLLSFLSGAMLEKIGYSPEVYFALGALIADFHLATANFENATYRQHHPYLCLERTEDFLDEIDYQLSEQIIDQAKRDLLVNSISEFRTRFLAQRDRFEHGFIHSDFNETNVLLVRSGQDVQVTGLLDFGDSHYSCLVFDLVSAVLYMMLDRDRNDCEWWTIGAHLIAGYQSRRTLPTIDAQHILLAVRTRLCLSLAYGLRTARLKKREGGDCSYVLKTQSNGWEVLKLTLFSSAAAASTETVVDSDAEESGAERNEHDEHGERVDTSEKEHTGPSSSPLSPASSATP